MTGIRYGVALPYLTPRNVARLAQQAEAAGWDGCFLGDAIWCEDPMIGLAAAAMSTSRIRLGTLITPVPLRRPWKLASESLALDHLSDGRLTLGLAMGATWMGWHAFPNEVTDTKARAGMLDETIDILTLLYQRRPFDYDGRHYRLKLTEMDEMHYPPRPVQQPRIPLWCVGVWPRQRSMGRVLKCDGIIVEKRDAGSPADVTPADIAEVRAYVAAHRTLTTPFDIVVSGKTVGLTPAQRQETVAPWIEAGLTWWVEGLWEESEAAALQRIAHGPPAG